MLMLLLQGNLEVVETVSHFRGLEEDLINAACYHHATPNLMTLQEPRHASLSLCTQNIGGLLMHRAHRCLLL